MQDSNPAMTPMDPNVDLTPTQDKGDFQKYPYQNLIGSLMFVLQDSRPDLAHAVSALVGLIITTAKNTGKQVRGFYAT